MKISFKELFIFFIFLILGLGMSCQSMIFSGFRLMQTDLGDTRLASYILEHGYQWLKSGMRASFWNPLFYYPHLNVAAYAEVLIGTGPFYWIWRMLSFEVDTSLQLWMITLFALDYFVAVLFLIDILKVQRLSAYVGAFLFAFGAPRVSQLCHQQLLPVFYSLLSLWALCRLFIKPEKKYIHIYFSVFFLGIVLQCYSGFYMAWFYIWSLVIAAIWAFFRKEYKKKLVSFFYNNRFYIIFYTILSLGALYPFFSHYLHARAEVGDRSFSEVKGMLPSFSLWFYHGPDHWIYGWMSRLSLFNGLSMEHERRMGIGFLTLFFVVFGIYRNRKNVLIHFSILVVFTWFVCTAMLPYGKSLWGILYPVIPGAGAVRAVSRIGIFFLIAAAMGVALWLDRRIIGRSYSSMIRIFAVIAFIVLEQGASNPSYNKIEDRHRLAALERVIMQAREEKKCESFYYSPIQGTKPDYAYHLDAMLVSQKTGFPTLNGYSGSTPPGWFLESNIIQSKETEAQLSKAIYNWATHEKLNPEKICWIKTPDSFIGS